MKSARVALSGLAFFVLSAAASPLPTPTQSRSDYKPTKLEESESKQKQAETQASPAVVKGPPSPISTGEPTDEKAERSENNTNTYFAWLTWWWPPSSQNVLNLFLVLVGAGQFYLFKKSIPLAKKAADAAKESADTQKQALLNVERPHLLFEKLEMFGFYISEPNDSVPPRSFEEVKRRSEEPRFPKVTFQLKNYGKGPAWIKGWSVQFDAFPQLPLTPNYQIQPVIGYGYTIPAGEAGPGECRFGTGSMTYEQWMLILTGKLSLFVYGFVEYSDIFKEKPHKSGFCWKWITPNTLFPKGYWEPSGPESYWYYE